MNKIQFAACSMIMLLTAACGKSGDKDSQETLTGNQSLLPQLQAEAALAGTYQQAENGIARLEISPENIVTGTTLEIPSPSGDGTRLTPRFPQGLIFDPDLGYFSTIGTYNDGTGVFRNVELRLRLYEQNRFLDVTLVIPPDAALGNGNGNGTNHPGHTPGQNMPGQNMPHQGNPDGKKPYDKDGKCDCPEQLFYVYRFVRI